MQTVKALSTTYVFIASVDGLANIPHFSHHGTLLSENGQDSHFENNINSGSLVGPRRTNLSTLSHAAAHVVS